MNRSLAALLFLISGCLYAQDHLCGWYGTLSAEKRRAMPPFSSAEKIVLISFFSTGFSDQIIDENGNAIKGEDSASVRDNLKMNVIREFDVTHLAGKTKKFAVLEMAELNTSEKDSLSRWFFNYRPKKLPAERWIEPVGCFTPRNAVIFLDASAKVVAFIEVCFECRGYYVSPDVRWFNDLNRMTGCHGKIDLLMPIFRRKQIGYGVNIMK